MGLWVAARKVALRFGALAVGSVVLVWWNRPGPKGVVVVALAVLVILAGIEVVGRVPGRTPDVG